MLTLTDSAGAHLNNLLEQVEAPEGTAARFVNSDEGLTLQIDEPQPSDEQFEHDGKVVLLLDEQFASLLDGRTLDVEETENGPELTLQ